LEDSSRDMLELRVRKPPLRKATRWLVPALLLGAIVAVVAVLYARDRDAAGDLQDAAFAGNVGSAAEARDAWPRFRGPGGAGRTDIPDIPARWDVEAGENICWKAPVPLQGASSPVVWGDRVYLTGADAERRTIFAYDALDGTLLWSHDCARIRGSPRSVPRVHGDVGFAASTPATDGERVYAVFANGDIIAVDRDGARVWAKALGLPLCRYGFSSSPVLSGDLLLLQFDQSDRDRHESHLLAFDTATGDVVWDRARPVPASYTTPVVYETEVGARLLASAPHWTMAHDLESGQELWRVGHRGHGVDYSSSPIVAGDRLLILMQGSGVAAIESGGRGDVSDSHVAWFNEDVVLPDVVSPVSDGRLAFVVSNHGLVTCLDVKTGQKVWEHQLRLGDTYVSPSLVGERLLVVGKKGAAYWVPATREGGETARLSLGSGPIYASPAFATVRGKGRMFVRSHQELLCVGAP